MKYLKLFRLPYLIGIAVAMLVEHYCVVNTYIGTNEYEYPWWMMALTILTTICIAAGAFVINDYYDMRIDEVNRPFTRIVGNDITKASAMNLYIAFSVIATVLSVVLGIITRNVWMAFVYASMVGLLWFYSSSYKRIQVLGNVMVAGSVALIPLMGVMMEGPNITKYTITRLMEMGYQIDSDAIGFAADTINTIRWFVGMQALAIFGWMMVHEIVRNMEEENGEREMECHTIPIVYGVKAAKYVAIGITVLINIIIAYNMYVHFTDLQFIEISYFVCTSLAFSAALIYFINVSEQRRDFKICRNLIMLNIAAVIGYSVIFWFIHLGQA